MGKLDSKISRRDLLKTAIRLGIVGAAVRIGTRSMPAIAKVAKEDFHYQDRPNEGHSCATCKMFTRLEATIGVCAVVDGEISSTGWCMAYSSRDD